MSDKKANHIGLSGIKLTIPEFDLGEGIKLRQTFAHHFSHAMLAVKPPTSPGGAHPAPWLPANSGSSVDIEVELFIPANAPSLAKLDETRSLWIILTILRMVNLPFASAIILSDVPFNEVEKAKKPFLFPLEQLPRRTMPRLAEHAEMKLESLKWVASNWPKAARLATSSQKFLPALEALDRYYEAGKDSAAMMSMWGGIELLFCTNAPELKFRVSAFLASYLGGDGAERLVRFNQIKKLYDARSKCAHTGVPPSKEELSNTYLIFRSAMSAIIETEAVPTEKILLKMLFGDTVTYADFEKTK